MSLRIYFIVFSFILTSCSNRSIQAVNTESEVRLQNDLLSVSFDKKTGQLISIINKTTNDDYIKTPKEGNVFRLYVNTERLPFLKGGAHNQNYGGTLIEPSSCNLVKSEFLDKEKSKILSLIYFHEATQVEVGLKVELLENSNNFDMHLSVENKGSQSLRMYTAFPYLTGICLGQDKETNLTVNMYDRGYPNAKAWEKPLGGVYGKSVSMQWQTVYEPIQKQGLAFITLDANFSNKILTTFPEGGMTSLYFEDFTIESKEIKQWPSARILAYNGNWRTAARAYREWLEKTVKLREVPQWYKNEVTTRSSTWLPKPEVVTKNKSKEAKGQFTSFEQLHDLFGNPVFGNNYNDCMEIAMWNEGVNLWPKTYGPWMSSGFLDFRSDLGGIEAFKKGVETCHAYGRRVAMYVAGYGARKNSPVFEGDWEKYAIKNERGNPVMDYRKGNEVYGAFNCPGYKPWQDNLIRVCTMLANTGVDEIRLDEFGFPFRPCFNEHHGHESPYNSNKWMRDCLKRIRQATDKINSEIFISTEFYMDYFNESTNGALVMDCSGSEIDVMKVAMPSYLPLSYHASASEAAITGAIMSKTSSKRNNWAWANVGTEKPKDYDENFEINLKWHELYSTFADAITYGEITEWDPVAENDSKWMGHLWKSKDYWTLTGGHIDATPLFTKEVLVKLPELPTEIKVAYEFNVETCELRNIEIDRKNGAAYVSLKSAVSAVLFPFPTCPTLPLIKQNSKVIKRGSEVKISVLPMADWKDKSKDAPKEVINLIAPGFEVMKERIGEKLVFTIPIAVDSPLNNFHYTISGDCLKVKRWFQVIK